jgi:putative colanic acid biosysnthesis UDP-glucose lipid carrier transferase
MKNSPAAINQPLLRRVDFQDEMEVLPGHYNASGFHPLQKRSNIILKRCMDLAISTFLIVVVFSWLFPLIALIIKLNSKGPVFFLQRRKKKNGHLFTCIKFRTMIVNEQADVLPAAHDDSRITGTGSFLRRYHLDEWPQLLNVWWGDMSLIGPRPHMISDNNKYEQLLSYYHSRHKVKPGITGLAQVSGFVGTINGIEDLRARIEKDLFYINNWSLFTDISIIYKTTFRILGIKSK